MLRPSASGGSLRVSIRSSHRHRTRIKSAVHAHLIPPCPHADLFSKVGRSHG
jgi:hypothetical protein